MSPLENKAIRKNNEITHIVIHHTQDLLTTTGERHNKDYVIGGDFGSPYDIIIDSKGKIDLSPQWTYALNPLQYTHDVPLKRIVASQLHHHAEIGKTLKERKTYAHVALIGDFDFKPPTPFQINSLLNVLESLCLNLQLCIRISLFYQNELRFVSSPGILFPEKESLIKELLLKTRLKELCEVVSE